MQAAMLQAYGKGEITKYKEADRCIGEFDHGNKARGKLQSQKVRREEGKAFEPCRVHAGQGHRRRQPPY